MLLHPAASAALDAPLEMDGSGKSVDTRWQVFRALLGGRSQADIARVLGISPQAVSLHVRALVERGILEEMLPRSYPRVYRRGPNAPALERSHIPYLVELPPETAVLPAVNARVHAGAVRFDVVDLSRANLVGWKTWTSGAKGDHFVGVPMAKKEVDVEGRRYVVEIRGRTEPSLIVRLPERTVDSADALLEYYRQGMGEEALRVARQVVHAFNVAIDATPRLAQKPEIAFQDSTGVFALSQQLLARLHGPHGYWVDASKGDPELETTSLEIALIIFTLPALLRSGRLTWVENSEKSGEVDL